MAHKKVHPADRKGPLKDDRSMNPPASGAGPTPAPAGDQQHDAKRRMGAFVGKGDHARQQQMGNKD